MLFNALGLVLSVSIVLLESLDPLDIEDYLAEILSNEFNIIIEDGSLVKVLIALYAGAD